MKMIRRLYLVVLISLSFGLISQLHSQSIYFCEGVDKNGDPINSSSSFTIGSNGGYLYVLIQLPNEVDCSEVYLEIYKDDDYNNTISIETKKSWTWFWKKVTFYEEGEYIIDVYDCDDDFIVSGKVEINIE